MLKSSAYLLRDKRMTTMTTTTKTRLRLQHIFMHNRNLWAGRGFIYVENRTLVPLIQGQVSVQHRLDMYRRTRFHIIDHSKSAGFISIKNRLIQTDSKKIGDTSHGIKGTKTNNRSFFHQLKSVPNILTSLRILATPYISYLILSSQHELAAACCIAAVASDGLDGAIARKYPETQSTVLGTYLDPLADKVLVCTLGWTLCGLCAGPIPTMPVVIWTIRDVALIGFTYTHVNRVTPEGQVVMDPSKTPLKVTPSMVSRLNTVLQFSTIVVGLSVPLLGGGDIGDVVDLIANVEETSLDFTISEKLLQDVVEFLAWSSVLTAAASGYGYWGGASLKALRNKSQK